MIIILAASAGLAEVPRIDLPAWGPDTVLRAAEAGLQALVFEAGASIAVDRERAVDLANGHGLALIGVEA